MSSEIRSAYTGLTRKLVLAFDIGTTFSGISYSILDPGQVPEIKGVTRYPSQDRAQGTSKIPTIIYYDKSGTVRAVGAEATSDKVELDAQEGHWFKAEWFKLHLRPNDQIFTENIPPLPSDKTALDLFADFLKYLYDCSGQYIRETHLNGSSVWSSVKDNIDFIISHPNGWEGGEQTQLYRAMVLAKLIPDTMTGRERLSFVTEGEASLHFAIQTGTLSSATIEEGIVIVDAGGGTIDVSAYRQDPSQKKKAFEEIAPSQCILQGSVYVNINARTFLQDYLKESSFIDDLDHIIRCFDQSTKLRFKDKQDAQHIKFGSARDNDAEHNIRFGQLKIEGSDVALFFYPSVTGIIQAVLDQRSTSRNAIVHVILVGGFSASDWLFNEVSSVLTRTDVTLNVVRPEEHTQKAVSYGALSYYLDHFVRTRVSRSAYGSICNMPYNAHDIEHCKRRATKYVCEVSGNVYIPNAFAVILPKNTQVSEETEFRASFCQLSPHKSTFHSFSSSVYSYRGNLEKPKWKDLDPAKFEKLCSVVTDLSHLNLVPKNRQTGGVYYQADYDIVLLFGLTEMRAQLAWKENGLEKRSAAKIIYEETDLGSVEALNGISVKGRRPVDDELRK